MKRSRKGFTLVEIMIVVAIIALLAAIAIPNLLRARHNANESAAIASLRTISTAMESYRAAQTPARYADAAGAPVTLAILSGAAPPYIDGILGTGTKQGYGFVFTTVPAVANGFQVYEVTATPTVVGTTGTRIFRVQASGVVEAQQVGGGWRAID